MSDPPFSYFGSKAQIAQWIVDLMPNHKAYIEPFAGSAAVLLRKNVSTYEVLNDWDGQVMNFWTVLRENHDALLEVLQLTPYSREEYRACRAHPDPSDPVERARRFFVGTCLAYNSSGTSTGYSAGSKGKGAKPATFHKRIDERLAQVAQRLRLVELENIDALRLIERWKSKGTLVYADPPYLGSVRAAVGDYAQDNGSERFHSGLLDCLKDYPGKVILSGYSSPLYDRALKDWCTVSRTVHQSSSYKGVYASECLWLNYEPEEVPA